ncbi:hypothetical protein ACFWUU_37580 [Kribbella sp. NPDC058693]|uniref:Uncharacterized protein n=1 Tax=Kribbella jiaozuonensis TaxID=2575441 RepID=A0A4U3LLS4_9ACTN|nr:hypothetical protein [Kribbella jiaozuonensis]TKK76715.1 hypothetical protein FDA38_30685 [Kribbella jiaozuonensis]
MAFSKKKEQARDAVANGGKTSGKQAKKATQAGHLGDDNRVYHRGKVVGDFSNRTRKQPNEHGA